LGGINCCAGVEVIANSINGTIKQDTFFIGSKIRFVVLCKVVIKATPASNRFEYSDSLDRKSKRPTEKSLSGEPFQRSENRRISLYNNCANLFLPKRGEEKNKEIKS